MSLPQFKLLRPRTVEEAISLLGECSRHAGEAARAIRIVAGGTDLIPSLQQKLFEPQHVLDIRHIPELKGIRQTEAAKTVASPILRNMGTIGGNICLDTRCLWYNQSLTWRKSCGFCIKKDGDLCHVAPGGTKCWAAFSADTPPALLCLNAEIEIASASGVRRIPLLEFYTGLGDSYRNLAADELLTRVILPKSSAGYRGVYRKLRIRGSIDYPLAGVAVVLRRSNGHVSQGQVALTAVNPAPVIVKGASELLAGKAVDEKLAEAIGELAARTAKPLTTSALTPEYRREMIRVFTKRALLAAANGLAT